jgi:putative endonuclease
VARYDLIATYMMASQRNGTLYLGVTSDLFARVYMHQQGQTPGFAQKYGCKTLVWYERHDYMRDAIDRETQLKRWRRAWKIKLIEERNPQWLDLYPKLFEPPQQ